MESLCASVCGNLTAVVATVVVGVVAWYAYGYWANMVMDFPKVTVAAPAEIAPGWRGEPVPSMDIKAAGEGKILSFDPATGEKLGEFKAWTREEVGHVRTMWASGGS